MRICQFFYKVLLNRVIKIKRILAQLQCILLLMILCSCSPVTENVEEQASKYALIDLHLHLDGSVSPDAMIKMAEMSDIQLSVTDPEELTKMLSAPENCKDLNEYLQCFDLPLQVLQTKETISFSVYDLVKRLETQGLLYAEIRFAPQLHMRNALTQQEVVEAAIDGLNQATAETNLNANLILCCMRGEGNEKENLETVRLTELYLGKGVVACDLAGAEAIYPSSDYEELFKYASSMGVPFTFHAGEASGVYSVRDGLSFGAHRIGHGIRSFDDAATQKMIIDKNATLELCPTSNLQTKALPKVKTIKDYPINAFFENGVAVTINTDNMTVSNTTLANEFSKLLNNNVITSEQAKQIVYNSVDAAFLPENEKNALRILCDERMKP
ncbi:MAG: adenosine deaminase [Ruthenibacterium sp.]